MTDSEKESLVSFAAMLDSKINKFGIGDASTGGKNTPPEILYHYTKAESLQGILSSRTNYIDDFGTIWATHYSYLNDTTEYIYFNALLDEAIDASLERKIDPAVKRVLRGLKNTKGGVLLFTEPYIASFSSKGNDLSQWRAYGTYAIGLSPNPVMTHELHSEYSLRRVIYKVTDQKTIIAILLNELCTVFAKYSSLIEPKLKTPLFEAIYDPITFTLQWFVYLPSPLDDYLMGFIYRFSMIAACMKDEHFEIEEEWRLIHIEFKAQGHSHFNTRFRAAGGMLVPYIELPLRLPDRNATPEKKYNFTLKSISHGPSLHPESARRSLDLLIDSLRLPTKPEIKASKIPVKI